MLTGSIAPATKIIQDESKALTQVMFELGGKLARSIFESTDLAAAAQHVINTISAVGLGLHAVTCVLFCRES